MGVLHSYYSLDFEIPILSCLLVLVMFIMEPLHKYSVRQTGKTTDNINTL